MKIETFLDFETILANQAAPVHFALNFQAPEVGEPRQQPAAFCLIIDQSGSMKGLPLQRAKEAAAVAIKNLRAQDLFSLVAFDEQARTIIPLQNSTDKAKFEAALEAIKTGGSTNLTGGWMLGRDELRKAPVDVIKRVLLLTDGHLNVGIVEPDQVRALVAQGLEQSSIRTSCLGFGDGYNEDLLSKLATATGGIFYDAVSPEKFPAIFEAELIGLQKRAIQNLRVRIKPLDFCDAFRALGEYPSVNLPDGRFEFQIGDLVSGEQRIVIFQLGVLPLPTIAGKPVASLEGEELLGLELVFDELSQDGIASKTFTQTIRIQSTQDPASVELNAKVVPWVALQRSGKAMAAALKHLDCGQREEAVMTLMECIDALGKYGSNQGTFEAIVQLKTMVTRILSGDFNSRDRKSSRYRSASFQKMSSHDLWSAEEEPPSFKQEPPRPAR